MKIGISTASFFSKLYTEQAVEYVKAFNAETSEIFFGCTGEYYGKYSQAIIDTVARVGLDVHSVHGLTNQYEPELFGLNSRAVEDAEVIFRGLLGTANKLGAHNYTLHGPAKLKNKPYIHDYDRLGRVADRLCVIGEEYGVSINYENVHWAFFSVPEYFTELKRRCPKLGATLDIKQAVQSGYSYIDYLAVVSDRLKTVHVCDVDSDRRMLLPGRGNMDYADMFKRLADVGFDGAVIMEVYPESYDDFGEVKSAYEFLLESADKAGVSADCGKNQ